MTAAASALITTSHRRDAPPAHEATLLLLRNDVNLRAVRAGHGPSVLLLHGYGESLVSWRAIFDRLAQTADVVALDLRGFGLSSKPDSGYDTETLARDVLEALSQLQMDRAVLVGHSLGGAVASAAALLAPDRVRALVLIAPAVVSAPGVVPDQSSREIAVEQVRAAIAHYEALRTRFTPPHDPAWLAEPPSALTYVPGDDPAYRASLAAVLREFDFAYLTPERRQQLRIPVLLIWGAYDPLFPISGGRMLEAALPRAKLVEVARAWHRPHIERPDTVATVIAQFVRSLH